MKRVIRIPTLVAALLLLALFAGCEKPRLKSQGDEREESESEMLTEERPTAPVEEREPLQKPPAVASQPKAPPKSPEASRPAPPKMSEVERVRLIAAKEEMLKAQLAGIRSLESDLSQRTGLLNELQRQLQTARARQSGARGEIRVEMVDGKSSRVGDASAVRDLQGKVSNEEQFVEQLSKALAKARQQYADLSAEVQRLSQGF